MTPEELNNCEYDEDRTPLSSRLLDEIRALQQDRDAALAKLAALEQDKEYILKAHAANEWEDRFQIQQNRIKELQQDVEYLKERAAFGEQCWQDQCENAYVEQSVVKRLTADRAALLDCLDMIYKTIGGFIPKARAVIEQVSK